MREGRLGATRPWLLSPYRTYRVCPPPPDPPHPSPEAGHAAVRDYHHHTRMSRIADQRRVTHSDQSPLVGRRASFRRLRPGLQAATLLVGGWWLVIGDVVVGDVVIGNIRSTGWGWGGAGRKQESG